LLPVTRPRGGWSQRRLRLSLRCSKRGVLGRIKGVSGCGGEREEEGSQREGMGLSVPDDAARCWWCKSLSSWEPQVEGMMSTAASFSLSKKPRFIESRKKPNSRRWCWLA
jgi:hypothetical protein